MGKVKICDFHIFNAMRFTIEEHFPEFLSSFDLDFRVFVTRYLRKVQDRHRMLMLRKNLERVEISVVNSDEEYMEI